MVGGRPFNYISESLREVLYLEELGRGADSNIAVKLGDRKRAMLPFWLGTGKIGHVPQHAHTHGIPRLT